MRKGRNTSFTFSSTDRFTECSRAENYYPRIWKGHIKNEPPGVPTWRTKNPMAVARLLQRHEFDPCRGFKGPALLQLWEVKLWLGCNPWLRNFYMPQGQP